jgi:hypothetical protein
MPKRHSSLGPVEHPLETSKLLNVLKILTRIHRRKARKITPKDGHRRPEIASTCHSPGSRPISPRMAKICPACRSRGIMNQCDSFFKITRHHPELLEIDSENGEHSRSPHGLGGFAWCTHTTGDGIPGTPTVVPTIREHPLRRGVGEPQHIEFSVEQMIDLHQETASWRQLCFSGVNS